MRTRGTWHRTRRFSKEVIPGYDTSASERNLHARRTGWFPVEASPHAEQNAVICDVCGAPALEIHCKIVCRRCGYTRDCGDP